MGARDGGFTQSTALQCECSLHLFQMGVEGREEGRESRGGRQREENTDTLAATLSVRGETGSVQWGGLCEAQSTCWSSLRRRTRADRGSAGSPLHLRGMNSPNMSPRLLLCAVLAVYHGTQTCSGFNIDERFPVIKEGKTKGSFFGFSVALHQQTEGSRKHL